MEIKEWMENYKAAVTKQFGSRIWFMGIQGSYGRGEATPDSDIDVVLILDQVTGEDLAAYRAVLEPLPQRDKICGFVSGKNELLAWEPSDLFQFYYDTTPIMGSLDVLLERITRQDIERAVRLGACNVYHMCVHNLVHEQSLEILQSLYKSVAFTLQAVAFLEKGIYEKKKSALADLLSPNDRRVLDSGMNLKAKDSLLDNELTEFSSILLDWASKKMEEYQD